VDEELRTRCPKLSKKVRLKYDEREKALFLLYPERGMRLNETAAAIVGLADGTRTVYAIVDELASRFSEAPKEQIEEEVLTFLEEMRKRALMTFHAPPADEG
jgi:pyrroloquinoline quinone biosynthesis protein D